MTKILVIEDDEDILLNMSEALEMEGYVSVAMTDTSQALSFLKDNDPAARPDCILLDLMMPKVGGHQFLKELASIPGVNNTKVIIMTANGRFAPDKIEPPVVAVLTKPFELDELYAVIRIHLPC